MCLIIKITLSASDTPRVAEIAMAAGATHDPGIKWLKRFFPAKVGGFVISDEKGGCSCGLLADDADWDHPTWSMTRDGLTRIRKALEKTRAQVSGEFQFEAMWVGEEPKRELSLTLQEMLEIVQRGEIGTRTRYLIT